MCKKGKNLRKQNQSKAIQTKHFQVKKFSRNSVNFRMIHEDILSRAKIIMNSPCSSLACFWHVPQRWLKKVGDCIQHLRCFVEPLRVSWEEFWSWLPGFFRIATSLSGCLGFLSSCRSRNAVLTEARENIMSLNRQSFPIFLSYVYK